MPFDPDQYLKEKTGPFDPDAYLKQKLGKAGPDQAFSDISPTESFLSSLAPKGAVSAMYGAGEAASGALSRPFSETLDKYRKERDYARDFLEESDKQNPRSTLAGKVVGTTPFAIAAGPEIPAQAALGGLLSGAESKADLTRLSDPKERARLGMDVGTGTVAGGLLGGAARYAPVTTAAVGTGALAGGLATGDTKGTAIGAGLGLLLRGGMAGANPVAREAVKNFLFHPYETSPNAQAILDAAGRQGIAPEAVPGYMLTENEEAKRAADSLLKSGKWGGGLMRQDLEPVKGALKEGTENLLADATPKSAYEVGTAVQKGVRSKSESMLDPISEQYEALDQKYGDAPASSRSVKNVWKTIAALQSEPGLGPEARSILGEVRGDIEGVETIGDLKKIRTNLNNQLKRDGQGNVISDKNAIRVVSELNDAFTKARENSIKLSGKTVSYDMSKLPSTSKEVPDVGQMSPLLLRERLSRGEIINVGDFEVIPTGASKGNRVSVYKNGQLITKGANPGMNSDDIGVAELPALLAKHDKSGSLGSALEESLNTPTQGRTQPGAGKVGINDMSDTELGESIEFHANENEDPLAQKALDFARSAVEDQAAEDGGYKWDNKKKQYVDEDGRIFDLPIEMENDPDLYSDFHKYAGIHFRDLMKKPMKGGAATELFDQIANDMRADQAKSGNPVVKNTEWTPIALPKKTVTTDFWDGVLKSPKVTNLNRKSAGPMNGWDKQIGKLLFSENPDGTISVGSSEDGRAIGQAEDRANLTRLIQQNDPDNSVAQELSKKGFKIPKSISYDREAIANQRAVDAKYRGTIGEIEKALPYGSKGGKGGLLPVEKLERVQPEKVRASLGLFTDQDTRNAFKTTFPEEAELVRRSELAKIKASSTPPQGEEQRNPRAVLNSFFGAPRGTPRYDEAALLDLLKEKNLSAKDLQTIASALPQNYNPSGTASASSGWDALLHPKDSIGSFLAKKRLDLKTPSANGLLPKDSGKIGDIESAIQNLLHPNTHEEILKKKGLLR